MRTVARMLMVAVAVWGMAPGVALAKPGGVPAVPLTTGQETQEIDSEGHGFFSYTVEGSTLCYTLEVQNLTGAPVAAHIHLAPRNVDGGIVVPLLTPPAATSTVSDCITAVEGGAMTPAELAGIVADPGAYYVNVHTARYRGGEVRGQLK